MDVELQTLLVLPVDVRTESTLSLGSFKADADKICKDEQRKCSDGSVGSTTAAADEEEDDEGESLRCSWRGRRRTTDSISDPSEEDFLYRSVRRRSSSSSSCVSEEDSWRDDEWADDLSLIESLDIGEMGRMRTVSVLSIPEEFPSTPGILESRICRSSTATRFPLDCRSVDDYDPRKPGNVAPQSLQETADAEMQLLHQQIKKLQSVVKTREAREPNSVLLEGYRKNIVELQERVARFELDPRAAILELGGEVEEPPLPRKLLQLEPAEVQQ